MNKSQTIQAENREKQKSRKKKKTENELPKLCDK